MVPVTGLEPVRYRYRGILSPLCLPIPPHRRISAIDRIPYPTPDVKSLFPIKNLDKRDGGQEHFPALPHILTCTTSAGRRARPGRAGGGKRKEAAYGHDVSPWGRRRYDLSGRMVRQCAVSRWEAWSRRGARLRRFPTARPATTPPAESRRLPPPLLPRRRPGTVPG